MIKLNPKNGTGSKLEPVLRIQYSEMAIPMYWYMKLEEHYTVPVKNLKFKNPQSVSPVIEIIKGVCQK